MEFLTDLADAEDPDLLAATKWATHNQYITTLLILWSDPECYGGLVTDLINQHTRGIDGHLIPSPVHLTCSSATSCPIINTVYMLRIEELHSPKTMMGMAMQARTMPFNRMMLKEDSLDITVDTDMGEPMDRVVKVVMVQLDVEEEDNNNKQQAHVMDWEHKLAHNLDARVENFTSLTHSDHNNDVLIQRSKQHLLD